MTSRISMWGVCFSLMALLSVAQVAHAHDDDGDERPQRFALAVDLDYSSAIDNSYVEDGGAFGVRIGTELDTFLVTLIPELNVNYHRFSGTPDNATAFAGLVGGRIRFLKIVEPGIFAHAGIGHVSGFDEHLGFAFDAGVTVDLTILPLVDLGLHLAWNRVFGDSDDDGLSYSTLGAHVALVL